LTYSPEIKKIVIINMVIIFYLNYSIFPH